MSRPELESAVRTLRHAAGGPEPGGCADADLLARVVEGRDSAAFEAVVRRHGPMVLGVCRRVLDDHHDAEDAFQAAFLLLARHAGRIRRRQSLAAWLHGVALRVAHKARVMAARRRRREREAPTMPPTGAEDAVLWADLRPVLDEELGRLPEKYRAPLVLCYLEGKTHEEAARQLGWPNGTVSGRLARGRDLLRRRLERRGVTLSATAVAAALAPAAPAALPAALVETAIAAAAAGWGTGTGVGASSNAVMLADTAGAPGRAFSVRIVALAALTVAVTAGSAWLLTPGPAAPPEARPTGERGVLTLHCGGPVQTVAISPDGALLATGGPDGRVKLWGAADGRAAGTLPGHAGGVLAVLFSLDGKRLATGGHDRAVRVWDVAGRKLLHRLTGHDDAVAGLAWTPDGDLLASAGWDGKVCLWDAGTGLPRGTLEGHRGRAWAVAFSPDGKLLASAGGDRSVFLWDPATGRGRPFGRHTGGVYGMQFAPDGRTLFASEGNSIRAWDLNTGGETGQLGEGTDVAWFALSPDGRTVAWSAGDRSVRLAEPGGAERLRLDGPPPSAGCLAFSADGRTLAAASPGGVLIGWHLEQLHAPGGEPGPDRLAAWWADLDAEDAGRAYRAVWALAATPGQSVPFLRGRLGAGPDFDRTVGSLIAGLDDNRFATRERAARLLAGFGPPAADPVRQALAGSPTPEARERLEAVRRALEQQAAHPPARARRAVEALELAGTAGAAEALEALARRAAGSPLGSDARAAADRLRHRLNGQKAADFKRVSPAEE